MPMAHPHVHQRIHCFWDQDRHLIQTGVHFGRSREPSLDADDLALHIYTHSLCLSLSDSTCIHRSSLSARVMMIINVVVSKTIIMSSLGPALVEHDPWMLFNCMVERILCRHLFLLLRFTIFFTNHYCRLTRLDKVDWVMRM